MMSFYPLTSKTQNVNKIKTFDSHQSMYCKMWGVRNTVEKVDFLDVMTSQLLSTIDESFCEHFTKTKIQDITVIFVIY